MNTTTNTLTPVEAATAEIAAILIRLNLSLEKVTAIETAFDVIAAVTDRAEVDLLAVAARMNTILSKNAPPSPSERELNMTYGYGRKALTEAFEKVQDKTHWKNPISAVVNRDDLEITLCAIRFFTATEPTATEISNNPNIMLVESIGYAAGPAGDH